MVDDYTIWIQFVGHAWLSQNFSGCTFESHNLQQKGNHKQVGYWSQVAVLFSFFLFTWHVSNHVNKCKSISIFLGSYNVPSYQPTSFHKVLFLIINWRYVFRLETNIIHLLIITNLFILVGNKLYPFAYYYMMFVSINWIVYHWNLVVPFIFLSRFNCYWFSSKLLITSTCIFDKR